MRQHFATVALTAAVLLSGCGCQFWNRWRHPDPYAENAPCTFEQDFTKERLIGHINQNIARSGECAAWRCDRVKVRTSEFPAPLSATMAVRAPHSLRLVVAHPLGAGNAMDLGSNDECFWMWMKVGEQTPVMTVRHEEFDLVARSSPMPLPIRPDWLMEVLGVVPLDPEEYELVRPGGNQPYVDLVATRVAPGGERVQRIVRVNPRHGLIVEHRLQKLNGELVGRAALSGHFEDPASKVVMPRVIVIDATAEGKPVSLTLTFDHPEVNPASLAADDHLWLVPEIPGSERVDMAQWLRSQGRLREPVAERPPVKSTKFSVPTKTRPVESTTSDEPVVERENPFAKRGPVALAEPEPVSEDESIQGASAERPLEAISRRPRSIPRE